ncbi:related to NUM1 - nuclear migration protein [Pseudozyma flocculosa]|uniref:Related to NUM1 - nuclear migration protein n=1 Tax=Pseudozyma flocculosa TaxID=84751 RepID=A0A5C3FCH4_9BASI|nr:related to NUM1 - nuclear migration protein [Pseudozyma flocculosa]
MDSGSTGEASVDGLFHAGSPPSSPSPAPRGNAPPTPKEGGISASLSFRPPPRPGSSMRKGRKSDFNSPAPPPLPTAFAHEPMPFSDATNFEGYGHPGPSASTPSRPSSSSSADQPGLFNFLASNDSAHRAIDTTRACRQKLQALREENQTQVNSAGLLGAGLLELRNRIEALMDELADELSTAEANADDSHDTGSKIKQLSERIEAEIEEMEYQKGKLYRDVMAHGASELAAADQSIVTATDSPSKAARVASAIKNLTGTTPSKAGGAATPGAPASASAAGAKGTGMPTPRQGDRRSRNAAARQAKADSELINEIQAGLVQEVRRLQGLLKERDDQRGALERTNAELEKQLDLFKPRVIQMTEAEDALKQENWDLEVAKQGLEEQLGERDKLLKKAELETTRLAKDLGKARETIDSQRLELDAHLAELERTKKQRETEVAMARKERAGMQRDVSDLQSELQRYKAQQLSKGGLVSRSVSNSYMTEHDAGDDDDDDAGANDPETLAARLRAAYANEVGNRSPADSAYSDDLGPRSPAVGRLGRDKEAQDLRAKLAMAQKKAGKDAAEKRRVREKNAELKKLLAKAGVKLPAGLDDDDDVETSDDEELQWRDEHGGSDSPSVKRLSASKLRPGKLGKRPSMARRLGMSSSASNDSILERSEELDDELDESTTDGDRTLAKQHAAVGDDSTSTEASPRASLEGYDPAFADVTQAGFGTPATQPKSRRQPGRASAAAAGRGSPLAHAAILADSDEGDAMSPPRSKSRQQGRRSHAAGRPESAVFEPSALGNELENLRGSEDFEDAGSGTLDVDTDEAGEEEEEEVRIAYEEVGVATEPLPDLVGPALEEKEKVHLAAIARLQEDHATALSARAAEHANALAAAQEDHRRALEQLGAEHEEKLVGKDRAHAATLASTLADRTKIHDAALAEARSRHSRALADQVAASSAALGEAIASHKAYVEQQELRHTTDRERRDESHAFALSQRDRQHADSIRALEESHASILSQQEAAYQKALEASEEALQKAQAEIGALKATIDDLNARILAAESKSAETESQRKADGEQQAAAIKELEAELASAASTKAEQESQLERFRSDIADLEARLTLTEQRASNVQSERDAASSDAIKKAQADVDALKAAALAAEARLKASEQDAAKQATDLRAELEAGHGQLRDANDKLQQAEQKVRQLEAERSAQETKLAEAVASLGAATAAADQHQKEASTQAAEAGRQKTLLAQLTAAHAELRDQAEEHERLRREADAALVRHQKEAREKQASLESEAAAKHTRLQNEVEATQSRLQRDAAEHARLQQEAQAERDRLQALAEEEGKLRKQAQEEATAASAAAAAATAAAAAAAAEAATAADSTPASATSASPSPGSPVPAGNVESREESDSGHATEAETDVERYEDAVSHMRSLSLERPVPYGMPTAAFRLPAELKESGCQTDDLMWSSFQDDMARTSTPDVIRPMSSMTTTSVRHENAVGQGGVMVLGGHQSSNRPRDSVSTFGGHRDGSMRIESPAPSMYTVGAVTGRPSRRGSADSSWSRQTDRANDVPPVPPLPDKTKPPVMSMPPPPTMPPPASLPAKRAPSLAGAAAVGPPRPTSPPPSDLLSRAAQRSAHLQVPTNGGGAAATGAAEQPRSVSRASNRSGMQPKPGSSGGHRTRQQSSAASFRTRTYSGETSASQQQQHQQQQRTPSQLDGSIYSGLQSARKSLNSRRSAAGNSLRRGPRQSSAASFVSDVTSELSRRFSLASSQASDDAGDETFIARPGGRTRGMSEFGGGEGTDPMVIHAITQTMIGEYMHKYTRKSMGRGGHSDKRHRRYFWVHPYTKMLYWTISDPGGAKVSEGTSKSASITGVRVVEDSNPSPPGLYHESLVIMTASREVKITAPSRERHEAWLGALDYLVNRPAIHDAATVATEVGAGAVTDAGADIENNAAFASRSMGRRSRGTGSQRPSLLTNQRNFLSRKSMDNVGHHPGEGLPRHRQGSVGASSVLYPSAGKRRDLAAREYLQQQERERQMSMSPTSSLRRGATRSIVGGGAGGTLGSQIDPDESYDHLSDLNEPISDPRLQTAEEMLEEDEGEGFEGLDNVRACCDGKHDVGSLAYDHSHHHGPNGGGGGGGSSSGRRSSKRHGRQSSGGSRFSNVVLRSKLDAAVRAGEDRERPTSPTMAGGNGTVGVGSAAPQLPLNLLPKMGVASSMGIAAPTAAELDAASGPGSQNGHGEMRSVSQPGPSYGERVHKIRQARQSASTLK